MNASRRSLVRRLIAFLVLDEFMPIFPVYALLFADSGLSTSEISSLLVLWSVVTFVLEVPSGAWADIVSRRLLLCLSSIAYGAAFATWVVFPVPLGFAAGFVLWWLSSALSSGTFQALAYDELAAIGARHEARGREHRSEERARSGPPGDRSERAFSVSQQYARVMGLGTSLTLVAMMLATACAAPLVSVGGYALTGWASVVVCAMQFFVAASLPSTPPVISVSDVDAAEEQAADEAAGGGEVLESDAAAVRARTAGFIDRYLHALRVGLREAATSRVVRGGVLASAVLMGLLAFDEYFGLLLDEQGASPAAIPLLLIVPTAGQAVGGLLAARAARWSNARIGWLTGIAGLCIAAGALSASPFGMVAVGVGYGALQLAIVVSDIRLQDGIAHGARATVTSVSGLLAEVVAVLVFAAFAWGSYVLSIAALVGILAAGTVLLAPLVTRWLPPARA